MKTAILCPGGGYRLIGTGEGEPVAERFRERGYDAAVLSYATGERAIFTERSFGDFEPVRELAQLMRETRARVGVGGFVLLAGFSAGGHLAAGYCLSPMLRDAAEERPMPDALLLSYPMLQLGRGYDVSELARGAFDIPEQLRTQGLPERAKGLPIHIWHATTDQLIPFESSPAFVQLLKHVGTAVSFAEFHEGRHGDPSTTPGWLEAALEHLEGARG